MARVKRRSWVKVWAHWYTRAEHMSLSAVALGVGPALMVLVDPDWNRDANTTRVTVTADVIARITHMTVAEAESSIEELISVGTLERDNDGEISWPEYGKEQETRQAATMRKKRVTVTEDVTPTVTPDVTDHVNAEVKRSEVKSFNNPPTPQGELAGVVTAPKGQHPDTGDALKLLNASRATVSLAMGVKCRAVGSKALKRAISGRLNDGHTLDDVAHVLAHWDHECMEHIAGRNDWDAPKYLLGGDSVFRDGGFSKRLGRPLPMKNAATSGEQLPDWANEAPQ